MSQRPEGLGRVGSYELVSIIEERCLLATYAAKDTELGRPALLRALAPNVAPSPRLDKALEREARALAKLDHPAIATLYEVVRSEGRVGVALEQPRGPTLAELFETLSARGGISTEEALPLVVMLVKAVAQVHERGLVHANISPRSIHVVLDRGIVLVGFDRARDAGADDEIARAGLDPMYLSPEELMDEPLSTASDVFALGVVAYELLAGKRPFGTLEAADETSAGSTSEPTTAARRVRTERATPIESARRVPADVERAVLRALSKQPGLRQADASELLRDLENAVGTELQPTRAARALHQRAGLGPKTPTEAPAGEGARSAEKESFRPVLDVVLRLGAVFLAMCGVIVAVELVEMSGRPSASAASSTSPGGYVRIVAHPWAEVWIDGVATDTTPFARPIPLSAGRHTLVFKHPRATDERRVVDVVSGEVLAVSVDMRVVAPPVDAGIDASP